MRGAHPVRGTSFFPRNGLIFAAMAVCVVSFSGGWGTARAATAYTVTSNSTTPIGTGHAGDDGSTVVVSSGVTLDVGNNTAISFGSGTASTQGTITIGNIPVTPPVSPTDPVVTTYVQNEAVSGDGHYPGSGKNTIEADSYYDIKIGSDAAVMANGSQTNGEAINVMGYGNTIENYGVIHSQNGAALWFQDTSTSSNPAERNHIENYGIISTGKGDTYNVFGSSMASSGPGLIFDNYYKVIGSLKFGNGNDSLLFYTGSSVTGVVDGGGGTNDLTLDSSNAVPGDVLKNMVKNFSTITKTGTGIWEISGQLQNVSLVDVQAGDLILSGDNQNFTGKIEVTGNATLTAAVKSLPANNSVDLQLTNSTLEISDNTNAVYTGSVIGAGSVEKDGTGTVTMAGANTYSGNTTIRQGGLAISSSAALGTGGNITILNGSSLVANASFSINDKNIYIGQGTVNPSVEQGVINTQGNTVTVNTNVYGLSTVGNFSKYGTGTLVLNSASNNYAGTTNVLGGTLEVNGAGLNGDTYVYGGTTLSGIGSVGSGTSSVHNSGVVAPGNAANTFGTLTINGNYVAQPGGGGPVVAINSVLGDSSSPTSVLHITGNSTSVIPTTVVVRNILGTGAATTGNGILAIQVDGTSWQHVANVPGNRNMFELSHDFTAPDGTPVVAAGDWVYQLNYHGGSWYLQNYPHNGGQVVIPNRPGYQNAASTYAFFNRLGTLQQRVGNRSWEAFGGNTANAGSDEAYADLATERHHVERAGMWTRVEGLTGKYKPSSATLKSSYSVDFGRVQIGVDAPLYKSPFGGSLVGGLTAHMAHISSKTKSDYGGGKTKSDGFGFGGTLTWYAANGFYVDAQSMFTWYESDIDADRMTTRRQVSDNDGFGYVLSLETGRQFDIGCNGWSLTPQAQIVYSDIDFDDFVDPQLARVSLRDADSLQGRLGLALAREKKFTSRGGDERKVKAYGLANVYHEFLDGTRTQVASTVYASKNDRDWGGVAVGGSFDWRDEKYSVYGEVGARSSFKNFGDSREFYGEVGFRLNF